MAIPKKILRFRPSKGLAVDIDPSEVSPDFWTGGSNVVYRDAFAQRAGGYTAVYDDMQADVRNILNVQSGGVNYWLYFGQDSVYVVETTNHTDITPSGGLQTADDPNLWTTGLFNGIPFANNTLDAPIYWGLDTGTPMADLSGWPSNYVCQAMRAHRNNLFAMNINDGAGNIYPDLVKWSNSAAAGAIPTAWTPAATNDAGSATLSATPGAIIDGLSLRSSLVVYKQHSAYGFDWIGGQYSYDVHKLFITVGMLNRNCAVERGGFHYLLTDGDVVITDGNEATSLIDKRMRNYLFNQLDQTNYTSAFVVAYPYKNEVWICYPTSGNTFCDEALVIDTGRGNPIGVRALPAIAHAANGAVNDTADSQYFDDQTYTFDSANFLFNQQDYSEANQALVMAYSNDATPTSSKLFQVDVGNDANGADNIDASLTRHLLDMGEPERMKFVTRIIPKITGTAGTQLSIRLGATNSPSGSVTYESNQTYTIGTTVDLYFTVLGKFIEVQITSDESNAPWTCQGFDLEYELRGYY